MPIKPTKMVKPIITEVSGVSRAANLAEGWLMMKSLEPDVAKTLARAEATATGVDLDAIEKGNSPMEITDEERAALPENVRKYLESQEEAVAKSVEETPEPVLTEEEQFEKELSELNPAIRKMIETSQREAAEAKEMAKALADEKADAQYTSVVKSLAHIPEVTDDLAPVLRKLAATDPDGYEKLAKVLGGAEAVLKESAAFTETGSGISVESGSGFDGLQKLAKSIQEKAPDTSDEAALAQAALTDEGRKLYQQHRREIARREVGV